jgi:hypothetical protein
MRGLLNLILRFAPAPTFHLATSPNRSALFRRHSERNFLKVVWLGGRYLFNFKKRLAYEMKQSLGIKGFVRTWRVPRRWPQAYPHAGTRSVLVWKHRRLRMHRADPVETSVSRGFDATHHKSSLRLNHNEAIQLQVDSFYHFPAQDIGAHFSSRLGCGRNC